jgi:hypothetical protein
MLRAALVLLIGLTASAAQTAEPAPLCKALHGLADAARRTGEPQRVTFKVLTGGLDFAACQPVDRPELKAFCDAAIGSVGPETAHLFPWRVRDCVQTLAADPHVTTGGPAGLIRRPILSRLTAKMGGGMRMDLSYASEGRYDLVVWRPR